MEILSTLKLSGKGSFTSDALTHQVWTNHNSIVEIDTAPFFEIQYIYEALAETLVLFFRANTVSWTSADMLLNDYKQPHFIQYRSSLNHDVRRLSCKYLNSVFYLLLLQ